MIFFFEYIGFFLHAGLIREAAKKVLFLVVRPLRRGGGAKGPTTKEKRTLKKIYLYILAQNPFDH